MAFPSIRHKLLRARVRVAIYIGALACINFLFAKDLFFAEFTDNMQNNAGAFMAIGRFLQEHWPHVAWFPWWFNGEPFENSYSPLLHIVDALVAWLTGASAARAYNAVTALMYVLGPVFLFLFAWRISKSLETSFFAALLYSLFSPVNLLGKFRTDIGSVWSPWRLRTLAYYAEGPHNVVVSLLPLVLLLFERAIRTRRSGWCVAAAAAAGLLTLTNTFGATDLIIACGCLIAVLPPKQMLKAAGIAGAIGVAAYVWVSPLFPPSLVGTLAQNAQKVEGDFSSARLIPAQVFIVVGFVCLWFATDGRIRDRFTRFCWLFAYVLVAITAYNSLWNIAVLPQPHRYALEMELAVALAAAFTVGQAISSPAFGSAARIAGGVICAALAIHQVAAYRDWARHNIRPIDITQTVEYRAAKWLKTNLPGRRVFAGGETATWLDAFADIPQMHAGHEPFNPSWTEMGATYAIYSDAYAGERAAEVSILWLKAFGCHAILMGPSRYYGEIFAHSGKFDGVLPVLWRSGRFELYRVPQRTESLAHVVPAAAMVAHKPINGLDTDEVERYVAALDDPELPPADLTWRDPSHGRVSAVLRAGEVISVQSTYDRGWVAVANGKPARITRDGIGMTVVHPECDGECSVDLVFEGGVERRVCWVLSAAVTCAALVVWIRMRRRPRGRRRLNADLVLEEEALLHRPPSVVS